jgi:hypothetical protein
VPIKPQPRIYKTGYSKMKTCLRKAVAPIWGPRKSVRNSAHFEKHWDEQRKINNKKNLRIWRLANHDF